jgi:hypothetical protein
VTERPTETNKPQEALTRDAANWAKRRLTLELGALPAEAEGYNVEGRHVVGPLQGFGKMWLKTYSITLKGAQVSPEEVIKTWRANFGSFWPKGNYFYVPLTGLQLGEVGVLDLPAPGGMRLSTGIMVLFADDVSFAFMTPEGHMFAAIITFSAHQENGETVLQVEPLLRTNDPLWEVAMTFYGFQVEDKFWLATLRNLAAHFGVYDQEPTLESVCVDPRRRWSQAKNVWRNSAIHSALHTVTALPRWFLRRLKRS